MKRTWLVLLLSSLLACGRQPGATVGPKTPGADHAPVALGARYQLEPWGLSAAFPARPTEAINRLGTDSQPVVDRVLSVESEGQLYTLECVSLLGRDRTDDATWIDNSLKSTKPKRDARVARVGELVGRDVFVEQKDGSAARLQLFAAGDSLFMAIVSAPEKTFDAERAEAFIGSLAYRATWRVEPLPDLGVTLAVPHASVVLGSEALGLEAPSIGRGFVVLGEDALAYSIIRAPVDEARLDEETPEQLVQSVLDNMRDSGTSFTHIAPQSLDGATCLEAEGKVDHKPTRLRVIFREGYLYMLIISAKRPEALYGEGPTRFMETLIWY